MSNKQSKQGKPHHHPHRRSHHSRPAVSPHSRRGRSRSRPERRARSSSVRHQNRSIPPPRVRSHSRSLPRRTVNARDIPFYIPPSGQNGSSIPTIIVEALRKQDAEQNEALTATNLGHRQPTPPPDPNAQENAMAQIPTAPAPAPAPTPGLKRRPSSSPAAANARRRRRRRPRPRQRSVISDPESDPIPPPRPQPAPFYPPRPPSPSFSFLGIKRTKTEKERREQEAKKKRDKREDRRLRKEGQRGRYEKLESPKRAKAPRPKKLSKSPPQRATSAPPLSKVAVQEQYEEHLYEEQAPSGQGSQRGQHQPRQKGSKQRHKKHHRRLAEQHHRRQQKRRNKFTMRDFFKSLRRKLGNLFRFTMPTPSAPPVQQPAPQYQDTAYYSSPTRDIPYNVQWAQYAQNESQIFTGQARRGSGRQRVTSKQQPLPYFMHGGRSPATSWHSRLSMQGSTRRFTATVESAPGSAIGVAVTTEEIDRITPLAPTPGVNTQRHSHQSSTSAISVIARRFMGPFLSEPGDSMIFENGNGSQKRLSWRSHKLLTAGSAPASRPVTPPSSRNPSPAAQARGRSAERNVEGEGQSEAAVPMSFPFTEEDRRSPSASAYHGSPSPVASPASPSPLASPPLSPDYGLDELFATPAEVHTPAHGTPVMRLSSPDYGIQRLFSPSPASTGSNFGLRRLFGD
ncbi:hypothetical protein F5B22DRAFT_545712 [Xylaria bambusicola]|uniref:uncharacterized protein n=1 Tax=Xylaria bambusicola TaxID=326684 RepID=UPI002008B74C|nr:uncharacterized protein F5B22DRAFT_545712 [Xylaria bambusicola]KAI0521642.1 hypothetical protein F5B22DRAFT_545712 [Xylaria bambusicola]